MIRVKDRHLYEIKVHPEEALVKVLSCQGETGYVKNELPRNQRDGCVCVWAAEGRQWKDVVCYG